MTPDGSGRTGLAGHFGVADVMRTSMDGCWIVDAEGCLTEVNDAYCQLIGFAREELIGQSISFVEARETPDATSAHIRRVLELGADRFETQHRKKDGGVLDIEVSTSCLGEVEAHARVFLVFLRDLTPRKRWEEGLRAASEARYRLLFEKSTEAIFVVDRSTGRYVSANPAAETLTGRALADLLQRTLFEVAPDAREPWRNLEARTERLDLGEVVHLQPDGAKRVAALSVVPLDDDLVIGFAHDLTDRKIGEAKLQRLSSAIDRSTASIVITDAVGNIEYVNPKFAEVTGYSAEEALGRNSRFLQSGRTPRDEHRRLWETISAGKEWRGEFENRRKDGEILWESASIASITDAAGVITHFVAVKEDITDRKRADEERRSLAEQLYQARKMEAVGRLAGGIAHDFNNILSVILSFAETIVGDLKPDEPLRADVEEIQTAARRATELTRQLLAFSRQQVLEPRVLDLNQTVAGTEKMLRRLLGADIELTTLPAGGLWKVKADPGQIEQIVMNLAVNARDAMPQGGKLTIQTGNVQFDAEYARAHVDVSPGPYVMLAMTDSGAGMDKETQSRLFEPFFTTKGLGKGTGLGLATVFGIVKQSGGHIWVYSEPGEGSTFKVYFPIATGSVEVRVRPAAAAEPTRGSETILLVEDDDQVRAVARGILRRNGYVVLEAPNGGEALMICEQHGARIHLLLSDVVLPRMSGRQLAERLAPVRPDMKVLFMSGYTDDAILQHGVLHSGVAFLQKPLTPTSLTAKVRQVLDAR